MCSFEYIVVPNPGLTPSPDGAPFWPSGRSQLVLLLEIQTDKIVARAIDPGVADEHALVFYATMLPIQKDPFVQAVRQGAPLTLMPGPPASNENRNPGTPAPAASKAAAVPAGKPVAAEILNDAIVITDNPGDGHGPKMYRLGLPVSGSAARATGTQG